MAAPLYRKIRRIIARSVCAIALYFFTLAVTGVLFVGFFPWVYKQFDHGPLWGMRYSPDGRFRMEYHHIPFLPFRPHRFCFMGMEFGDYDCPGYIRLIDNGNGDRLQEKYSFALHDVGTRGVDWKEGEVSIKEFARWPLPRR